MPKILEITKCENCKYLKCAYGECKKYQELENDNVPIYAILNLQRHHNTIITKSALKKIGRERFIDIIKQEVNGIENVSFRHLHNITQTKESYVVEVY
jgi:hypothetical protein